MYKILRISCCVIAALIIAAAIFIFVYLGWVWGLVAVAAAAAFGGLTFLFKNLQLKEEYKNNPPPPEGDFITGKVSDKEE